MSSPGQLPYFRAWRHLPRNLAFLLPTLPIAIAGFVVVVTLVVTGAALTIVWVGVPVAAAGLLVARAFSALELRRLAAAGQPTLVLQRGDRRGSIRPPFGSARAQGRSRFGALIRGFGAVLGDPRHWAQALFVTLVNFPVAIFSWCCAVVWSCGAAGGLTYWAWQRYLPAPGHDTFWLHGEVWHFFDPGYTLEPTIAGRVAGEEVFFALVGVVLLATLPVLASGLVAAHQGLARGILGERRSAQLERRVREAEASRESAVLAEDHSLRRLERDIHDGPQQRLIRLQYDLSSARRRVHDDPAGAAELVDGALEHAKEALDELRELSRGFAPPILQDRGLEAAIRSLAARSALPTTVEVSLADSPAALAEAERSLYFIASELLTNAIKHARATGARIALSLADDEANGAADGTAGQTVTLVVADDGRGGACEHPGHGLAGVRERLAGLRGTLAISSPVGGPTTITARIPLGRPRG